MRQNVRPFLNYQKKIIQKWPFVLGMTHRSHHYKGGHIHVKYLQESEEDAWNRHSRDGTKKSAFSPLPRQGLHQKQKAAILKNAAHYDWAGGGKPHE